MAKTKRKAPAFQFYASDFITGTQTLSPAEVGGYVRLLCYQWDKGSVPADDAAVLARIMVCGDEEAAAIWRAISDKFSRSSRDGFWRNSRLELERKKQRAFSKLQSLKGKQGGRGKSRGFTGALPEAKPGQSSLSSLFGVSTKNPPNPPGGGVVRERDITRKEREWALDVIRDNGSRCPHDPTCDDRYTCVGKLVGEKRHVERAGLAQGVA